MLIGRNRKHRRSGEKAIVDRDIADNFLGLTKNITFHIKETFCITLIAHIQAYKTKK